MMEKSLLVCLPISWDFIFTQFFINFMRVYADQLPKLLHAKITMIQRVIEPNGPLDRSRNAIIDVAIKEKADYLLWIDADQLYPLNLISKQLDNIYEMPNAVIAIEYQRKHAPHYSAHGRFTNDPMYMSPAPVSQSNYVDVDLCGMGGTIMSIETIKKIAQLPEFDRLESPWFKHQRFPDGSWTTEDTWFCQLAKKAGAQILIDRTLQSEHLLVAKIERGKVITTKEGGNQ